MSYRTVAERNADAEASITANGNREITGLILQQRLKDINDSTAALDESGAVIQDPASKGQPNGVARLDANGFLAELSATQRIGNVLCYGADPDDSSVDDIDALEAALDDYDVVIFPEGDGYKLSRPPTNVTQSTIIIGAGMDLTRIRCASDDYPTDYFFTGFKELRDFRISGANKSGLGVSVSNANRNSFIGHTKLSGIRVTGFSVGVDLNNVFSLIFEGLNRIDSNVTGLRCIPTSTGGGNGYFTTIKIDGILYIESNDGRGLNFAPDLVSPVLTGGILVVQNNASVSGNEQARFNNCSPMGLKGIYCEGTSGKPALTLTSCRGSLDDLYMNGTGGLNFASSTANMRLENTKCTSATDVINATGGSIQALTFANGDIKFAGGSLPSIGILELPGTTADGVYYPPHKPYGTLSNVNFANAHSFTAGAVTLGAVGCGAVTSTAGISGTTGTFSGALTSAGLTASGAIQSTKTTAIIATSTGATLSLTGGLHSVSHTTDANDIAKLPATVSGDIGKEVEIYAVQAFELRSVDATATLNGVTLGTTNEAAIAAGAYLRVKLVADKVWISKEYVLSDGTPTQLIPDGV